MEGTFEGLREQVIEDIAFVTKKMAVMRRKIKNTENLDIKDMADFHRYSETRLFLVNTLKSLEGVD